MSDPDLVMTIAATALVATAMIVFAVLNAWRGWLALKEQELRVVQPAITPTASARIEIADLKERIRKLEAIAAGVDL